MVDFCCGSNDFSLLMKEKLDKIGTRCSYKNYDLVQAKVNFTFIITNFSSLVTGPTNDTP